MNTCPVCGEAYVDPPTEDWFDVLSAVCGGMKIDLQSKNFYMWIANIMLFKINIV